MDHSSDAHRLRGQSVDPARGTPCVLGGYLSGRLMKMIDAGRSLGSSGLPTPSPTAFGPPGWRFSRASCRPSSSRCC
jgi:hypothetical protein